MSKFIAREIRESDLATHIELKGLHGDHLTIEFYEPSGVHFEFQVSSVTKRGMRQINESGWDIDELLRIWDKYIEE